MDRVSMVWLRGRGRRTTQVGDEDGEQDDNRQGDHAEQQGVVDGADQQLFHRRLVVAQGEAGLEHRPVAVAEGQVDDVHLGHKGDGHQQVAVQVHQNAAHALGLFLLDGVQGADGEVVFARGPLLQEEHQGGDHHGDHRDGGGEVVVGAILPQVLVVDFHREGAGSPRR